MDVNILAKCNPCLSNPCKNDGTCNNDPVDFYRCTCPYGFKVGTAWRGKSSLKCKLILNNLEAFFVSLPLVSVFSSYIIFVVPCRVKTVIFPFMLALVTRATMVELVTWKKEKKMVSGRFFNCNNRMENYWDLYGKIMLVLIFRFSVFASKCTTKADF